MVNKFSEHELNDQSYRIYTTLDPDLQSAAAQSVEEGIKLVDAQITKMRTKKVKVGKGNTKPAWPRDRKRKSRWSLLIRAPERCWRWLAVATTASAS